MKEQEIKISGMNCNHCVMAVKKELSKLTLDSSDVQIGSAKIRYDEPKVTQLQIEEAIVEAGFTVVK